MLKVNQELYELSVLDDGKCEIELYRVSSIDARGVFLIKYLPGITWGKLSKKNGDFGWLKPIPKWCRRKFVDEATMKKAGISPTRLGAWKHPRDLKYWEETPEEMAEYGHTVNPRERAEKTIASMIKKLKGTK